MKKLTLGTVREFGRRVAENSSPGVDHGHGKAMLVMGGGVRGCDVYATWPTLAPGAPADGDLADITDYRGVIGEVLEKRCGLGSLGTVYPVSPHHVRSRHRARDHLSLIEWLPKVSAIRQLRPFLVDSTKSYGRAVPDDTWEPPRILIAVDLVILTLRGGRLHLLLVRRGIEPFVGQAALPGGFLADEREDILSAARRELREEAGLTDIPHLEQLGTYGDPGRDPRGRVVSVAHLAVVPRLPEPVAGTDAANAEWIPVDDILAARVPLAFDHLRIVADGVERARSKLEHTALATAFCPEVFTLTELQQVYEAVWGTPLDPRNFYRKVQGTKGFVVPAGPPRATGTGRPARVYRAGPRRGLYPPMIRTVPTVAAGGDER